MSGNLLTADELIHQSHTRTFYQPGGPGTPRFFFGIDTQYHFIDGAEMTTNGDIEPIFMPDPQRPRRYRLVARQVAAPDLPTISLVFHEKWGGIPQQLMAPKCVFNMYEVHGRCSDLSDFYRGWEGFMLIYAGFQLSGPIDLGSRTNREDDNPQEDSADATGTVIYPAGALSFGEEGATQVPVEVIDVVFGTAVTCGDCGAENDGSQQIYALTRANIGSPSQPGQVVYSLDGGTTWATSVVTGIGTTAEPRYIGLAGSVLFVGTSLTTLFYTTLNADTGAPTTWSSVTLPVAMRDVYVQSPRAIYFSADSHAVYRTNDIATAPTLLASGGTADNLLRIDGEGETIVACGANGRVYYSSNNGVSWASAIAPAAASLQAVQVLGPKEWWVGSATGNLYRTRNRGNTWDLKPFPRSGTGAITDILFATRECAWISHAITNVACLVTSMDGGDTWTCNVGGTSRILNWPTFQRGNRLACPVTDPAVAANYLAVAGLAADGLDGLLLLGAPTII